MPRKSRKKCESGIYHVVLRGVNRKKLFLNEEDYLKFLEIVEQKKLHNQFNLFGYCLMTNHVHLLLHEKDETVSKIMSRIGTSYAWWINQKYDRIGHVFQGRFGSECIENEKYLLTVIRYIHHNPVKANMVIAAENYRWSSIHSYVRLPKFVDRISEPAYILNMIHPEREEAIKAFREFMTQKNEDRCLDDEIRQRKTDNEAKQEINKILKGEELEKVRVLDKQKQLELIKEIKKISGISQRQISRITGISIGKIIKTEV